MRLRDWLREPGASRRQLVDACGVTRQSVHEWINGNAVPSIRHILIIEKVTKGAVTIKDFA